MYVCMYIHVCDLVPQARARLKPGAYHCTTGTQENAFNHIVFGGTKKTFNVAALISASYTYICMYTYIHTYIYNIYTKYTYIYMYIYIILQSQL
jgi:hypothetical protein